jgi:hypothetical protein
MESTLGVPQRDLIRSLPVRSASSVRVHVAASPPPAIGDFAWNDCFRKKPNTARVCRRAAPRRDRFYYFSFPWMSLARSRCS